MLVTAINSSRNWHENGSNQYDKRQWLKPVRPD